ncbi:Polyphosphate:AMP phosphotransferase [Hymenobacter roseosalivarius DSM 11622]|uniref:Polyphosphate:AMP phosphotransferase n=1 Tax=Hymenobacter roseosalivarius DSM 11622 TaxID=645990 RepID=A0A1W1V3T3_9BACT|nr:PPK2 family polyphosphate kinase [Hymenobacter roseosalivarius]SMB87968.1 Polyphosphate:AMP phosphotransferase [Hymenobacter roseosalivarius DSM 11622]
MKTPAAYNLLKAPSRAPGGVEKEDTESELERIREDLGELQYRLYAENRRSVLVVLQGMDASGKDGLIRRVFSGINPQGVQVHAFKEPTEEELAHDFLWRVHHHTPRTGMIHVFNRSHYEDVLITRVLGLIDEKEAKHRFEAINAFENLLQQAGTTVLKFYLHVSEKEQRERLTERVHDPTKQWKYEAGDEDKAKQWPEYRDVYEDVFRHCSPKSCPWTIVPSDQNWYKAYVVAKTLCQTLQDMDPRFPPTKAEKHKPE